MSQSTIELFRNDMKFSAAHFTIFDCKNRERLHGHNYYVHSQITAKYLEAGITYDYSETRQKILELCRELNEYMLLPDSSPHLKIEETDEFYKVTFDQRTMYFLRDETRILPVENVTSEELARYFCMRLFSDFEALKSKGILEATVKISTTQGQYASHSLSIS